MSIKDYFNVVITNIFRNKKNVFYIIVTIICTILALGCLIFHTNLLNYIEDEITKNLGYRTLLVPPETALEDGGMSRIATIKHIDEVYNSKYAIYPLDSSDFKNDNLDGVVGVVYGSTKTLPKIIEGRSYESNEIGVAICPINFYPDASAYNWKIKEKYIINGKDLLGKTFSVEYSNESKEKKSKSFVVVGLYDNKSVMRFNNECYIPPEDIISIVDFVNPQTETFYWLHVVVDDLKNMNSVNDEIKQEMGYYIDSEAVNVIDYDMVYMLRISCNIILSVVLFIIILITVLYMKKKLLRESKMIGVLKANGYDRKTVANIYFLELVLINMFSYVVGLIMFSLILLLLSKTVAIGLIYYGVNISINLFSIIASLIIVLIPVFVTKYNINKKSQLDVAILIGNEE